MYCCGCFGHAIYLYQEQEDESLRSVCLLPIWHCPRSHSQSMTGQSVLWIDWKTYVRTYHAGCVKNGRRTKQVMVLLEVWKEEGTLPCLILKLEKRETKQGLEKSKKLQKNNLEREHCSTRIQQLTHEGTLSAHQPINGVHAGKFSTKSQNLVAKDDDVFKPAVVETHFSEAGHTEELMKNYLGQERKAEIP